MRKLLGLILALIVSMPAMAVDMEAERAAYLNYYGQAGRSKWLYGVFRQLARSQAGLPFEEDNVDDIFATIKTNRDCNDFTLNGLLRMVYLDKDRPVMTESMKERSRDCILDFKYWWDDQRADTTYRCYHTENHQALYHTAELLAGQLYKDTIFSNGMTGQQHMEHATERLLPWLDYRFRFGFSEWLSTYYEVEALLLTNLIDFAEDAEIRRRATNVLHLLLFDMALNSRHGYLCGSSGRVYATSLISGTHVTSPLFRVAFGIGDVNREEATGAVALATSTYRCPEIIAQIARDTTARFDNIQRVSINVEDAPLYGLSYDKELDCHLFWGMQEFIHPLAIEMSKSISTRYGTWPYGDYDRYIDIYRNEAEAGLTPVDRERFALSEANIVTRRTPHYNLSTAIDYRKGKPAYQQHPWAATLGKSISIYTNSPGSENLRQSPNYWAGNEFLPRAAQHGDVAICIYNLSPDIARPFSHAYFPANEMDSVHVCGNWTFGCKDNGYIGIYSSTQPVLTEDFRGILCDLKVDRPANVWICQMGDSDTWTDFASFRQAVLAAPVEVDGTSVRYASPSSGNISFGWDDDLIADGKKIATRHTHRYNNPFCEARFGDDTIVISHNGKTLSLTR